MTTDDQSVLARLNPEYRAYIERSRVAGGEPLTSMSVEDARTLMRDMQNADVSGCPVTIERHAVGDFSVEIIRPSGYTSPLPVILYLHGGGWVLGDAHTHARMARDIVAQSQAAMVFVEYGRAPEFPFPLPLEHCYQAFEWVVLEGPSLDLDPSRIAVAGDSAGGNLAAALALLAKQRKKQGIRLQALLYPVTDCDFETPSYEIFSTGLNLDRETMQWFWDRYAPDEKARMDPLASPLRTPLEALHDLPPALVITAECDVLRDEAEAYALKLAEAGVCVTSVRFGGTLHGFMMIDELAQSTQAVSANRLLIAHLRQALQSK
jgi:acetyl esterase/lipase